MLTLPHFNPGNNFYHPLYKISGVMDHEFVAFLPRPKRQTNLSLTIRRKFIILLMRARMTENGVEVPNHRANLTPWLLRLFQNVSVYDNDISFKDIERWTRAYSWITDLKEEIPGMYRYWNSALDKATSAGVVSPSYPAIIASSSNKGEQDLSENDSMVSTTSNNGMDLRDDHHGSPRGVNLTNIVEVNCGHDFNYLQSHLQLPPGHEVQRQQQFDPDEESPCGYKVSDIVEDFRYRPPSSGHEAYQQQMLHEDPISNMDLNEGFLLFASEMGSNLVREGSDSDNIVSNATAMATAAAIPQVYNHVDASIRATPTPIPEAYKHIDLSPIESGTYFSSPFGTMESQSSDSNVSNATAIEAIPQAYNHVDSSIRATPTPIPEAYKNIDLSPIESGTYFSSPFGTMESQSCDLNARGLGAGSDDSDESQFRSPMSCSGETSSFYSTMGVVHSPPTPQNHAFGPVPNGYDQDHDYGSRTRSWINDTANIPSPCPPLSAAHPLPRSEDVNMPHVHMPSGSAMSGGLVVDNSRPSSKIVVNLSPPRAASVKAPTANGDRGRRVSPIHRRAASHCRIRAGASPLAQYRRGGSPIARSEPTIRPVLASTTTTWTDYINTTIGAGPSGSTNNQNAEEPISYAKLPSFENIQPPVDRFEHVFDALFGLTQICNDFQQTDAVLPNIHHIFKVVGRNQTRHIVPVPYDQAHRQEQLKMCVQAEQQRRMKEDAQNHVNGYQFQYPQPDAPPQYWNQQQQSSFGQEQQQQGYNGNEEPYSGTAQDYVNANANANLDVLNNDNDYDVDMNHQEEEEEEINPVD